MAVNNIPSIPFLFTTPVTLIYPRLFEAKAFKNSTDPTAKKSFNLQAGIAQGHPQFNEFWAVVTKAAQLLWPGLNLQDPTQVAQIKWPIISGADKANMIENKARLEGKTVDASAYRQFAWIVSSKAQEAQPPTVAIELPGQAAVDVNPSNVGTLKNYVYGGGLAMVKMNLKATVVDSGPLAGNYVSAWLGAVQIVPDPTTGQMAPQVAAFQGGGSAPASSVFANYKGHVSNVSPTAGLPGSGHPFAPGGMGNPGPQTF